MTKEDEQSEPVTIEYLLANIEDGLGVADTLIDLIPTRLQEHEEEYLARIGRLINTRPNPNNSDMPESGYRKIAKACKLMKQLRAKAEANQLEIQRQRDALTKIVNIELKDVLGGNTGHEYSLNSNYAWYMQRLAKQALAPIEKG